MKYGYQAFDYIEYLEPKKLDALNEYLRIIIDGFPFKKLLSMIFKKTIISVDSKFTYLGVKYNCVADIGYRNFGFVLFNVSIEEEQ